ncbi:MAG: hypothetical protein RI894_464 [Bacteroidota bacterium]|jgi:hypothetical protein
MFMKQTIWIAILGFTLLHSTATFAQDGDDETPANVVKLNVGSLFMAHLNLSYQRALGNHFAVQCSGMYGNVNLPIDMKQYIGFNIAYLKSVNYEGWGVVPELRYYPLNITSAPRGWYLNAFYQFRQANIKNCVDEQIVSNPKQYTVNFLFTYTGVGLGTGYQFMFGPNKRIVIDANVGLKYSTLSMRTRWDGIFKFDPIENPSKPGDYWVKPEDAATFQNYINNEIVGKVNNQEIGFGFLSAIDIFRSALYLGYAF